MGEGADEGNYVARAYLWRATLFVVVLTGISGCAGYVPGRKAYWDDKVREMCAQDGGITVFERTALSTEQYQKLPKIAGSISIPPESVATPETPLVAIEREIVVNESNPRVTKWERAIKRVSDSKVVGNIVRYSRVGGDVPTGIAHSSQFSCPEIRQIYADQMQFFSILGVKE
jgi:hypothetical protein